VVEKRIGEEVLQAVKEVVGFYRHIVDHPDDVKVEVRSGGYSILVVLHTNPQDVGQAIGRNAHLISSIRSLLSAISGKNNIQIVLDFVTEGDSVKKDKID